MVLGKNIAHDMKSGAEGAHFFGALLLTFSFDKHMLSWLRKRISKFPVADQDKILQTF